MGVARISKEELKARLESAADAARPVIVDARLKYPYEHSTVTLPGALRLGAVDASTLPKNRDIVVYDSDPDEIVSERVAADLIRRGFAVVVLRGGIGDWVTAKLPTDSKHAPQPLAALGSLKG